MFVIADSQSMFNILHSVGTSQIYLQTKFQVLSSIASLVMANKLKTNFPRRPCRYFTCKKYYLDKGRVLFLDLIGHNNLAP